VAISLEGARLHPVCDPTELLPDLNLTLFLGWESFPSKGDAFRHCFLPTANGLLIISSSPYIPIFFLQSLNENHSEIAITFNFWYK
jgi:hypothetical protein